ncbi:tumor necrosis factor receptor superfamily member 5-like isoform X2 [Carassius auratus]|uniref:Tumor necrosis factor receptor superfamily member 5-like isoform X2 n=1 Tax=Carassius auratus TaxID=7957 RepID=A0A6P6N0N7_CARAU|nr:tumor necrosis factor receptor superfamily member 5-like isoform X2 [Carassius auratus]
MFALRIIIFITVIVPLNYKLCSCQCSHAEYEIHKQCCPMCAPGNRVYWHCTDDTSTTCVPCPSSTFTDEPNNLTGCFPCTVCDASTGSTDTVCADCTGDTYSNGSFSSCLAHTKCEALGLTETNPGTNSSDTKCGNPSTAVAITAPSVIVTLIIILVILFFIFKHIWKKKQSKSTGIQETGLPFTVENDSSKVDGDRKIAEPFETEVLTTCD